MKSCPSCHELGIYEHSVSVSLEEARAATAEDVPNIGTYSQCARCQAPFRRDGPDGLIPLSDDAFRKLGTVVWTRPPWKEASDASEFQMSWDVIEGFFERLAAEDASIRPLRGLVAELRAAGYDARLRAGQSLSSLGLSRARQHGLGPGHSRLFLAPAADGAVVVTGKLGATVIELGRIEARLEGVLRSQIEALANLPLE